MPKGSFRFDADFSALYAYRERMAEFQKELDAFMEETVWQLGELAIAKLKEVSPVLSGELRKHWLLKDVRKSGTDWTAILVNSMDYASYVNDGHATYGKADDGGPKIGWVEGQFFVENGMLNFEVKLPGELQKRIEALIRKWDL